MNGEIDYLEVLKKGVADFDREKLQRLISDVIPWRHEEDMTARDRFEAAVEVLEDVINISVPTSGLSDLRECIIQKARASGNPDGVARIELRKAVRRGVYKRYYNRYQRRIYYQVRKALLALEKGEDGLQSTIALKRAAPIRTIRELKQTGRSCEEIAVVLNSRDRLPGAQADWTSSRVSKIIARGKGRRKRVGLKAWGDNWVDQAPNRGLEEAASSLPAIPMYRGEGGGARESKLFDSGILPRFIHDLVSAYGAPLTIRQIAEVVEDKLSPPPYRTRRNVSRSASQEPDGEKAGDSGSPDSLTGCAANVCESEAHVKGLIDKLRLTSSSDEWDVLHGLDEGYTFEELAIRGNCSKATISNRTNRLRHKLASLDPDVQHVLRRLEAVKKARKQKD